MGDENKADLSRKISAGDHEHIAHWPPAEQQTRYYFTLMLRERGDTSFVHIPLLECDTHPIQFSYYG